MRKKLLGFYRKGEYRKAISFISTERKKGKNNDESFSNELAFIHYHLGNNKKALMLYRKDLADGGKRGLNDMLGIARVLALVKDKSALEFVTLLYKIIPSLVVANQAAYIATTLKKYEEAIRWHNICLKHDTSKENEFITKANIAISYDKAGDLIKAKKFAKISLAFNIAKNPKYLLVVENMKSILKIS